MYLKMMTLSRSEVAVLADLDFEAVYRAQAPAIYRFCLTQLHDPTSAEDAAADVFAAALRAWDRVDPALGVNQWLFRIARNVISDHYRAARRRDRLQSVLWWSRGTGSVDPEVTVALREDVRRAGDAVRRLKERDRVLVGLRVSGDFSHADIGRIMGMSEESVRVAIHRALKKVRERMENANEH